METKDNNDIYNEKIDPLIRKIMRICNENKIPFFTAFGTRMGENRKYNKDEGGIRCEALLPEVLDTGSEDPTFAEFVNVLNGFHTHTVVVDSEEIDMGDC